MQIRFGYVAMALNIMEGSPNKTVTVTNLLKIAASADRVNRLRRLTRENLANQLRVLKYNAAHDIHVFRFTSKLIPLATHPEAAGWDYTSEFANELKEIGDFVRKHAMRVSAHPDHFTLLNSPDEKVIAASIEDLAYHARVFDAMGFGNEAKLVVHVGGAYKSKEKALERFCDTFQLLPANIKDRLIIENDDKSYTARDVLKLCQRIAAPMVLDVHHHYCCNEGDELARLWPDIAATWQGSTPKVHMSSSKEGPNVRAHADYINADEFMAFVHLAKELNKDFDVMLEAKQKDLAVHQLMRDLEAAGEIEVVDEATIAY